jgi:hypothetical protein
MTERLVWQAVYSISDADARREKQLIRDGVRDADGYIPDCTSRLGNLSYSKTWRKYLPFSVASSSCPETEEEDDARYAEIIDYLAEVVKWQACCKKDMLAFNLLSIHLDAVVLYTSPREEKKPEPTTIPT